MSLDSTIAFFLAAFAAIFVIVNPFSTASVFLSITRGDAKDKKKFMAKKASITAFVVLIVFALVGSYILGFFSITVDAFKIAGGIIIGGVGMKMLQAKREHLPTKKEEKDASDKEDISIIPLAIPMLSGPGSITTAIVLAGEASGLIDLGGLLVAIFLVCVISYLILINANIIDKFLGETGKRVIDRIMGLIVLVVGVQFIINGITGVIMSWPIFG
jgi:multiple antibiotic resistance protein